MILKKHEFNLPVSEARMSFRILLPTALKAACFGPKRADFSVRRYSHFSVCVFLIQVVAMR